MDTPISKMDSTEASVEKSCADSTPDAHKACVYFIHSDIESVAVYKELQSSLKNKNDTSVVAVGPDYGASTLCQQLISFYRKHRLFKNDRELVLSYEDFLVAVQLSLAEINKQTIGDFDVEVSRVMEVSKQLTKYKLHEGESAHCLEQDKEFQTIFSIYNEFLKSCNVVDLVDVFLKVNEAYNTSNSEMKKELDSTSFLFQYSPTTPLEERIVSFLSLQKSVKTVTLECPLDDSVVSGNTEVIVSEAMSLQDAFSESQVFKSQKPGTSTSVTELYLEQVFNGYLQLMVNSRCEIALSRVINVPERGLDHKAFTDLKRAAKKTGLSLFQTAVSFVLRIRLGGKGYQPDSSNALAAHVKGMSEFTDMAHKMQNYIEEDPNPRTAIKRIINCIKNAILKHRDNTLRRQSVENLAEKMQNIASSTIDFVETSVDESPKRAVGSGGSALGRKTIKVLRQMMDYAAGLPSNSRCVDILSEATSSQKTPLRFPSILSKFKSPLELEDSPELKKSLANRMREKFSQKPKSVQPIPRFQACMDWAEPSHFSNAPKEENFTIYECLPSKTLVQSSKSRSVRKVLESISDQENVDACPTETLCEKPQKCVENQDGEMNMAPKNPRKRMLGSGSEILQKPSKKSKTEKKPKVTKKKTIPIQKGQKQLTAFFRM